MSDAGSRSDKFSYIGVIEYFPPLSTQGPVHDAHALITCCILILLLLCSLTSTDTTPGRKVQLTVENRILCDRRYW
jgi:hypothetical protein